VCPGEIGRMSRSARKFSSSKTIFAGISFLIILQKMQFSMFLVYTFLMKKYTARPKIEEKYSKNLSHLAPLVQHLLIYRNVNTAEDADIFLNPDFAKHTHDPFLMKDMQKAVDRILKAIDSSEKIAVYADYDADGVPGAAILHETFSIMGIIDRITFYIPHRDEEGFGFHAHAVDELKAKGVSLIITVDCGTVDIPAVERAKELGVDVIITDHHLPQEGRMPNAFAVVNPTREDCAYPFKKLCGAGVAFKLAQALLKSRDFGQKEGAEKWMLDLVGIATLSDMVPLVGENRVLAKWGLHVIRKTRRKGLLHLFQILKMDPAHITEDDVTFMITPRINAASRMGSADKAFNFLTETDGAKAGAYAEELERVNKERKGTVAALTKEAKKKAKEHMHSFEGAEKDGEDTGVGGGRSGGGRVGGPKVLVLGNPDWKPALLGPVASGLVDEFNVPVFLWGRANGILKGSCRSPKGINIVNIMQSASDAFIEFGGHAASGGFSVLDEKIHLLEEALTKAVSNFADADTSEDFIVDHVLTLREVNWNTQKSLNILSPFGIDNPKPLFVFYDLTIERFKLFGKANEHLELGLSQFYDGANSLGEKVTFRAVATAIGFFVADYDWGRSINVGDKINLVASIEKSVFRGRPEIRLRIVDIF